MFVASSRIIADIVMVDEEEDSPGITLALVNNMLVVASCP